VDRDIKSDQSKKMREGESNVVKLVNVLPVIGGLLVQTLRHISTS
jgi:hypothetical protein